MNVNIENAVEVHISVNIFLMMIYIVTIFFNKCLNYWIILILQVNNEVKRSFNKIDIFFNCLVKIVLSKDYKYYYNIFFRKDILDSLFDGYDAWIPPSFDKSKYFPPPLPIPVKMLHDLSGILRYQLNVLGLFIKSAMLNPMNKLFC